MLCTITGQSIFQNVRFMYSLRLKFKSFKKKLKTNGSVGLAIEKNWNWSKEPNLSFTKDSVYNLIVMDVRHHKIVQHLSSRYNLYGALLSGVVFSNAEKSFCQQESYSKIAAFFLVLYL